MVDLSRVFRAAKGELDLDPRRMMAQQVSRFFPDGAFNRSRTLLLRALGVPFSPTSCLAGSVRITGNGSLRDLLQIGPGCYISGGLHIDLMAPVRLGSYVYLGYDVGLITTNHATGESTQRCGPHLYRPITIGDGAWLGSRVVVLPGVTIGQGAIVAAGAVVARDVAANTLVGGIPAKIIRDLPTAEPELTPPIPLALRQPRAR